MTEQEKVTLIETEQRSKSNTHRIDNIELELKKIRGYFVDVNILLEFLMANAYNSIVIASAIELRPVPWLDKPHRFGYNINSR